MFLEWLENQEAELSKLVPLHEAGHAWVSILEMQKIEAFKAVRIVKDIDKKKITGDGSISIGKRIKDVDPRKLFKISLAGPIAAPDTDFHAVSDYKMARYAVRKLSKELHVPVGSRTVDWIVNDAKKKMKSILTTSESMQAIEIIKEFMDRKNALSSSDINEQMVNELNSNGINSDQIAAIRTSLQDVDAGKSLLSFQQTIWSRIMKYL